MESRQNDMKQFDDSSKAGLSERKKYAKKKKKYQSRKMGCHDAADDKVDDVDFLYWYMNSSMLAVPLDPVFLQDGATMRCKVWVRKRKKQVEWIVNAIFFFFAKTKSPPFFHDLLHMFVKSFTRRNIEYKNTPDK